MLPAAPPLSLNVQARRSGHHLTMTVRAELSSLTSSLTEITRRVVDLAESARGDGEADMANELFGVERSLREALRRITRAGAPSK
jgi:hypothetical protein